MHSNIRERVRSEGGFTLIELLVVMIIIAILMAVAIPTFLAQKNSAQKTKATANIKQIVNAVESCAVNNTDGTYTGCTAPTELLAFEKGLTSLTQAPNTFTGAPAGAVNAYGIEAVGTQGYRVSAGIKDGNVNVFFWETHQEDGTMLKECGTAVGSAGAVSGSRTCTNGRWG